MTTDELLAILADRGMSVRVAGGRPYLTGRTRSLTPALKAVLALPVHRAELLRRFGPAPPVEVRYKDGRVERLEWPALGWPLYPDLALWWRPEGDDRWRPVTPATPPPRCDTDLDPRPDDAADPDDMRPLRGAGLVG